MLVDVIFIVVVVVLVAFVAVVCCYVLVVVFVIIAIAAAWFVGWLFDCFACEIAFGMSLRRTGLEIIQMNEKKNRKNKIKRIYLIYICMHTQYIYIRYTHIFINICMYKK